MLPGGAILVADGGTQELKAFGPDGTLLWRAGGEGQGPGEFTGLAWAGRMAGDSIVTLDRWQQRIQIFAPDGTFARLVRIETGREYAGSDQVAGLLDPTTPILVSSEFSRPVPSGIVRWPRERLSSLDLATGALTELMEVPGHEASVTPREEGYSHGAFVFGKGPGFGAGAGRLAVIDTEERRVDLHTSDGDLVSRIQWTGPPPQEVSDIMDHYMDNLMAAVFPEERESTVEERAAFRDRSRQLPYAERLPLLRSVHLDRSGNIWVEPH